jgi:PAS domain S-box-containing protein
MNAALIPDQEARRLRTLEGLGVMDTPPDPVLDGLVRSAALLADCPISMISLVDEKRQWFKARYGIDANETPRELAFCAHAILEDGLFEVPDALNDPRFSGNPLVTGEPKAVFYAGIPLVVEGYRMGTLCVIDHHARSLSHTQRDILRDLARAAEHWLQSQRVHRDLRQAHAEHRKLLDNMGDGVLALDHERRILDANPAALRMLGYSHHELLQKTLLDLLPEEEHARLARVMVEGPGAAGRLKAWPHLRADGSEFWAEVSTRKVDDRRFVAVLRDVTEQRRMTQELARHQQHLEEQVADRTVELVEARRAAEAASEAKSAFLATMSHEIRTPMNGVVGIVDVLRQSSLTPYQRDLADTINDSAFALLRIIEDVLDFSKIEAGQMTLESEPVPLRRLVESVCDGLRAGAASRAVSLNVSIDPDLPEWIQSDPVRLRQILNNLLDNAIKFSASSTQAGQVGLWVEAVPGECLQLRVSDNGIGMTPEVLSRIFQPFVQAEASTTRRYGGTGLGLSICRRLTNLFGGWTEVESEPGQGATFTVTLPLMPCEPAPSTGVQAMPEYAAAPAQFAAPGGPLVLVAEDNDINQKVIRRQLALLGLDVEMAHDGPDALTRWRAGRSGRRHSMLLTDLHMPGIDGYALAAAIRSEEVDGERMPIVALSANAMQGEIDRCRQAGMDDYLSKPVQLQQLGPLLQRWLDLSGAVPSSAGWTDVLDMSPIDAFLPSLAVMDEKALPLLVGDEPEVLEEFRQRYMISALSTMDEMRVAMAAGQFASLAALAHRLKSSSRAMGAMALGACCEEVERAGAASSPSEMHALMVRMEEALAQVMGRLTLSIGKGGRKQPH